MFVCLFVGVQFLAKRLRAVQGEFRPITSHEVPEEE